MPRPKPNPQLEQSLASTWNTNHKPGTKVEVTKDDGSKVRTRTESVAHVIGGHTAVIFLEGISGSYRLNRVKATKG